MRSLALISITITIALFSFLGCNKPVYKYNKDFEGNWFSVKRYESLLNDSVQNQISINGGDGIFNISCPDLCLPDLCGCLNLQSGKAVMNSSKTQMKIGSAQGGQPLRINKEPYQDEFGTWKMEVNELVYTKQ
jgi:hypothetical protein